ncbi:alpha/beta hydrolase [Flavobacterium agrisoli]|uniref:Alpha/beta hydrolase fold domain-containing protein n=1 Tax=Flavobacterium agrisoli TaxID=2793066 RepID=A0A934UIK7_9FLAO|nr:alpha/beta hydrolase [Flavobacterium agrisoli]MBK0368538.1 alpha/beta hydrolase fold domain-containing protein [Flavobacterium agrisoli]
MKKINFGIQLMLLFSGMYVMAQIPKENPLFPNGIKDNSITHEQKETFADSLVKSGSLSNKDRVFRNISEPTYMLFPAAESNNKHVATIIFPGGGFHSVWVDKEGTDLAIWLSQQGITCMVVKYRTNTKDEKGKFKIPMETVYFDALKKDVNASVMTMMGLAEKLKFDKDKIGVMGFSAGGFISEWLTFTSVNEKMPWKPAFVGLIYAGDKLKLLENVKDKSTLPPFFMAIARDDKKWKLSRALPFLSAVVEQVDKSELHIYSKGDHGFGLAYDEGHSVGMWKESFYNWILDIYQK